MSDRTGMSSPFIYGRPVRGDEFTGREAELATVFNRLRNGESTAVVGEPHIGKSSFLLQLADEGVQQQYLEDEPGNMVTSLLDLHPISAKYYPGGFWQEVLEPLDKIDDAALEQHLGVLEQIGYARRPLERLFVSMSENGQRLVLLLDEFERLLMHPNFQDPVFFAILRSLATRTGGLSLVTASRMSVMEMNQHGRNLLELGSPFFSNLVELRLCPLSLEASKQLLSKARGRLTPKDLRFALQIAGKHPFLLQAMGATLMEAHGADRHSRAERRFYGRVSYHFDELWQVLDDQARSAVVILSLLELGGRDEKDRFKADDEVLKEFVPTLHRLEDLGLVDQTDGCWEDDGGTPLWTGHRWTVSTPIVLRWVHDVVIARTRTVRTYDEWLKDERYSLFLTTRQWNVLKQGVSSAVKTLLNFGPPLVQLFYQIQGGP